MKRMKLLLVAVAATWCCAVSAKEYKGSGATQPWLPLGLSIVTPPVQLPSPPHSLFGAMVNVGYGRMRDVCLLDVGLANSVTRNMVGLEVGVVNFAGDLNGLQLGVLNFSPSGGAWVFPILNFGF